MNKNLVTLIGLVLVGIIAYQAYLLGQMKAKKEILKVEKKEPKITVEIEKEKRTHLQRKVTPQQNTNTTVEPLVDEKKIKEDFNRLIKDIFGNPKIQKEIKENVTQMQQQLQEGVSQFQKEIIAMTAELQRAAGKDDLLKDLFQNFHLPKALEFADKGDHYDLEIEVPKNEKSTIDVKAKKGFLVILINQVVEESHEENGIMVKRELQHKKQILVTVPQDAELEKLDTHYDNGKLKLTLPKKVTT